MRRESIAEHGEASSTSLEDERRTRRIQSRPCQPHEPRASLPPSPEQSRWHGVRLALTLSLWLCMASDSHGQSVNPNSNANSSAVSGSRESAKPGTSAAAKAAPSSPEPSSPTPSSPAQPVPKNPEDKWEAAIRKFEAADAAAPPRRGGVVFIGSSSIVRWKLDEAFPDAGYVNRGFGGSQLADSVRFADRILGPHRPSIVVLYAGDNDLANGKTPADVESDFVAFSQRVHTLSPTTRIVYLSIKASRKRWALADRIRDANSRVARLVARDSRMRFVDLFQPMLGADGEPRAELLDKDQLHLSPAGYALWNEKLGPVLAELMDTAPDLILHNGRVA
ncbi:MAG: GDSL-type esterase/lipase family protein, partial [Planctomycetota bacterium]